MKQDAKRRWEIAWKVWKSQDHVTRIKIQTSFIQECTQQRRWATLYKKEIHRFLKTANMHSKDRSRTDATLRSSYHKERCQGHHQPTNTHWYSTLDQQVATDPHVVTNHIRTPPDDQIMSCHTENTNGETSLRLFKKSRSLNFAMRTFKSSMSQQANTGSKMVEAPAKSLEKKRHTT